MIEIYDVCPVTINGITVALGLRPWWVPDYCPWPMDLAAMVLLMRQQPLGIETWTTAVVDSVIVVRTNGCIY